MRRRLTILTEIIAPYRVPVFNALATREDIDLHVVFLSETDPSLRQWSIPKDEIRFFYDVLPSFRRRIGKYNVLLNNGVRSTLERDHPDAIVCGGYSYAASWQAAHWANCHHVALLLWIESTASDQRRGNPLVETMKKKFVNMCDGFVVPGKASADYLTKFKIGPERIFCAPNAVDNDVFAAGAALARKNMQAVRARLRLPDRYFLNVGRVVKAKGVFDLVEAYAKLGPVIREEVGLVFVGHGTAKAELIERAAHVNPGQVCFTEFVQKEQLGEYYALADALVFPTHSDTWGLVVNEAMAAGLPIIAGSVAGCVPDLVRDGWNGIVVPSRGVAELSKAMELIARDGVLRSQMAERSRERIREYSPEAWAAGMAAAFKAVHRRAQ